MGNSVLGWGELWRVTFTLALIVMLIYGLSVALRRYGGDRRQSPSVFKVLAAMSLGQKDKVYLLQVGNEQLVIGSSPAGLRALHTMQENVAVEAAAPLHASNHKFAEVLRTIGKGWTP
jgi:flagellar protein FliO/FliZ